VRSSSGKTKSPWWGDDIVFVKAAVVLAGDEVVFWEDEVVLVR
jgi:hypothetical protein